MTIRSIPHILNTSLMASLYFCALMNGSKGLLLTLLLYGDKSTLRYFSRIAVARSFKGTSAVTGLLSLVFLGIYSIWPFTTLSGVIFSRSPTRQPIKHWNMNTSRWRSRCGLLDKSKSAILLRSSRVRMMGVPYFSALISTPSNGRLVLYPSLLSHRKKRFSFFCKYRCL